MKSLQILYVLWLLIGLHSCCEESSLPASCQCSNKVLTCKGLESTKILQVPEASANDIQAPVNPYEKTVALHLKECPKITCLDPSHLRGFSQLRTLSVTLSGLKTFICANAQRSQFPPLRSLNLKNNSLTQLKSEDFASMRQSLTELNLSQNYISHIPSRFFAGMSVLKRLDLSSNQLNEDLKPSVFLTLPSSLQRLDVSDNSWACSSKLAWMHKWRSSLGNRVELENMDDVRCIHENDKRHITSPLFLVMQYYAEFVLPDCPTSDGCSCRINSITKTSTTPSHVSYIVHVDCKGLGLHHFPKLPERTQAVDLSDNELNDEAFTSLDVKEKHYDGVEDLTLDGNKLEDLKKIEKKLLNIPLGMRFSARNNRLTSIPYDLSQRFIKNTDQLFLSQNPWRCTCNSEINYSNLLQKVEPEDLKLMSCGSQSDADLVDTRIVDIHQDVLCPPTSNGEYQEILLQMLCVFLALMIVLVISKLIYDIRMYRTRGQLPWLALNF